MRGELGTFYPPADFTPDPARWRVLVVLLVALFMSLVDVSIVNVAIPSIQQGLRATASDIQWMLSGYALTFGVILVAAGRAGDIVGRGGLFVIGLVIFVATSVAAGLAPDTLWLDSARFIQGLGAGLLSPQALGMIQEYFRGAERGRAFGYLGTTVGVSVAIGPVLGGLLIQLGGDYWGWRLTFLVNLPVGIVAVLLALRWFPRPLFAFRNQDGASAWRSLDPIGSLLLGAAVLAVLLPFMEARNSPLFWLSLPLALLLTAAWVAWERHYAKRGHMPMVDLNIFKTFSFSNGVAIMTLYFLGMTSVWVIVTLYMQEGLGASALEAGAIGVPAALISALTANWAGRRVMLYGRRVVIAGFAFALVGLCLSVAVVLLQQHGALSVWWLLLTLGFVGIAQGLVISPNQTLTLAEVPVSYAGSSGAIMQTGQRIGSSVGIAMITAVVFAMQAAANWALAVAAGFGVIALVVLVAMGFSIWDLAHRRARGWPRHS